MATTLHVHPGIAVDADTESELLDNGETGDARVALCCALGLGEHAGETLFYLQRNADPVLLTDNTIAVRDFVLTLGCYNDEVTDVIRSANRGESGAWAIDQIEAYAELDSAGEYDDE